MNSQSPMRLAGRPPEWAARPFWAAELTPPQPIDGELQALESAFSLVLAARNTRKLAESSLRLAHAHLARHEQESALQYLVMAAEACDESGDEAGLRHALLLMAEGLAELRHFRQAVDIYERLLQAEVCWAESNAGRRATAGLAYCLLAQREYEAVLTRIGNIAHLALDGVTGLLLWRSLALAQLALGRLPEAAASASRLVRLATTLHAPDALAEVVVIAGQAATGQGQLDAGSALLEQGLALAERLGLDQVALMAIWHISDNLARRADTPGALDWYRRYVELKSNVVWAASRTVGQALGARQQAARRAGGLGRRVLHRQQLVQQAKAAQAAGRAAS